MQELAAQKSLIALDSFVDMSAIRNDYSSAFIDLGTVNGKLYAIFYKAANKGTVWYDPAQFSSAGYTTPKTWDNLTALSDQIAGQGKFPWSMGVESGSASGWPATDWISEIYINSNGPDMYDKWWKHQIPWTDPTIKDAFQKFGQIVTGHHYINGAPQSILATNYTPACYPPFQSPPTAYMVYLGDFAAGFISDQFKGAKAGTDYNFFNFPTINPTYQGALTGGVDVIVRSRTTTPCRRSSSIWPPPMLRRSGSSAAASPRSTSRSTSAPIPTPSPRPPPAARQHHHLPRRRRRPHALRHADGLVAAGADLHQGHESDRQRAQQPRIHRQECVYVLVLAATYGASDQAAPLGDRASAIGGDEQPSTLRVVDRPLPHIRKRCNGMRG